MTAVIALVNGKTEGAVYNFQDPAHLWKDTAGTTAVAVAGTDTIARCDDLSTFANHLLQAGSGNRPLWVQSGSVAAARFNNAASNFMRNASLAASSTQPFTVFIAFTPNGVDSVLVGSRSGNSAGIVGWGLTNKQAYMSNGTALIAPANSNPDVTPTTVIIESNAGTSRIIVNGAVVQTGPSGAGAPSHLTLGNDGNLSSPYFKGDIHMVGWFVGTVSGNATTGEVKTLTDAMKAVQGR